MTRSQELHAAIQQELTGSECVDCADALCRSMAAVCAVGADDYPKALAALEAMFKVAGYYLAKSFDTIKAESVNAYLSADKVQ